MRVRISYVEDVDDDFRRRLRAYHGEDGLATRQEIKDWFWLHGVSMNDDISDQEVDE